MFIYLLKVQVTVSGKALKILNFTILLNLFSLIFSVADMSDLDAAKKHFRTCICVNLPFYGHLLREWYLSTQFSKRMLAENDPTNCDFCIFHSFNFPKY